MNIVIQLNNIKNIGSFDSFISSDSLPQLLQGLAMMVITLQIAFAISILERSKDQNIFETHYFLDCVWVFKRTVWYSIINFLLPIFFIITNITLGSVALGLWLLTFFLLARSLFKFYDFYKIENKDEIMFYFLENKNTDLIRYLKNALDKDSLSYLDERRLFKIISDKVDSLILKNDYKNIYYTLDLLNTYKQKRNIDFVILSEEFLPKILEWNYLIWHLEYSTFEKGYSGPLPDIRIIQTKQSVTEILKFVTKESLIKGYDFSYFKNLKNHINKYSDKVIHGDKNNYQYIENIPVYKDVLENISDWKSFPSPWKVNVKNMENPITQIWYNAFINWIEDAASDGSYNKRLDEANRELFPDVEPNMWSKILTLVSDSRVGFQIINIIEFERNYGIGSRMVFVSGDEDYEKILSDMIKNNQKNTIELAVLLFNKLNKILDTETIDKWLFTLEGLKTDDISARRKADIEYWIHLLTEIRRLL